MLININTLMSTIIHDIAYSVAKTNDLVLCIRVLNRNDPGYGWKELHEVVNMVINHPEHDEAYTINELKQILHIDAGLEHELVKP